MISRRSTTIPSLVSSLVIRVYLMTIVMFAVPVSIVVAQWPVRSAHVVLNAPRGAGSERLLEELESAYVHVRSWGLKLPSRVNAWGYSTVDSYVRGSGGARATLASTLRGSIHLQPMDLLLRHAALSRTLRHEMVHVALDIAARRGLPRWFNEGLAMLVAGEMQVESARFATLAELKRGFGADGDHATARSAYATARRLVECLEKEYGRVRMASLVRNVGGRGGFPDRFRELTGSRPAAWVARNLKPR